MTVAITRILNGQITLLHWNIVNVEKKLTISNLFTYLVNRHVPQLKEKILKKIEVHCSKTEQEDGYEAELERIVSEVVDISGSPFITFKINNFSNDNNNPQPVNAPNTSRNDNNDDSLDILSYPQTQIQLMDSQSISQSQEYQQISNSQYIYIDKQKDLNMEQERFNHISPNFQQAYKPTPLSSTNSPLYQQNSMMVSSYSQIQEISSPGASFISRPVSPARQCLSTSQGLNSLSQVPEEYSNNSTNLKYIVRLKLPRKYNKV